MNRSLRTPAAAVLFLTIGVALVGAATLTTGCSTETTTHTTALQTSTSTGSPTDASYQEVTFATEDGLTLGGRLYRPPVANGLVPFTPPGKSGVVLCHMYPADQTSWDTTARDLSAQGLTVLTFDFRGYGRSQGAKDIQYLDRDVTAAVQFVRAAGVQELVLIGASMGGTACLKAAAQLQTLSSVRIAGVATFSAPVEFMGLSARETVPSIVLPLLFVAAEDDVGAEGARSLEQLSDARGELELLPGGDHGTGLFVGSQAEEARSLLLDFLQRCMPSAG
jgi:pimeloyl-ACP methyl ester carboxylesterase